MIDPYLPDHGDPGYHTEHYDLELDYRIAAGRLSGRATVTAVARTALSRFTLDLGAFRVARVQLNGRPVRFAHRGHRLTVFGKVAAGRSFTVDVRYVGNPEPIRTREWGEVGWDQLSDGVLVASQPVGAPSWFPCNDHPSDKATYRISVTTASPYHVVANGNLIDGRVGASTTTWVYEQTEPMASYLATVQIGRYEVVEQADERVPIRAVLPSRLAPGFAHDFGRQTEMMVAFERMFGPYPFGWYTVVVTDDDLDIPIEAQGLSIFGANHVDGHRGAENLVAHELAHQWFGNSLTVAGWQHIWLNEGMATYAEWLWSQASGGRHADDLARTAWLKLAKQPQDLILADPGVQRIFDDRVYQRGALAIHSFRLLLGESAFFTMLREWTSSNKYGTVTTDAFTALVQNHSPRPLADDFAAWLYQARLPELP
ncbi:M1 family metallopeptidase [Actinocrispum wychmicini]|uniref:Aminopeptidase N n=1 Tax=Actinocrispum wychmicini TaxID=1213861 RepID=A0A4R2IP79_9PSEU|nr:M1 family metallopeptidase [Actinocrispum wychmicini]TCO46707.1 peptidase M1-like protein [Actinocrispum wychmicini]